MSIIKAGTEDQSFLKRLEFLKKIPLFQKINTTHLQPLISNLVVKKYRKGEYIQREGEEPAGLMIIVEGYAVCVADKLSFRRVGKRAQKNIRDETAQMEIW
jgi:CRP-like cAMP-binding protein